MKEIVKSVAPIVVSKLKKLVGNRIKQIHSDSTQCNHRIKDIAQIVQLINETSMRNNNNKFNSSMELVRQYSPEEKQLSRKMDGGNHRNMGNKQMNYANGQKQLSSLSRPKSNMAQQRMNQGLEQIDEELVSNPSEHSQTDHQNKNK
jgi:hypothetical protein